ncbi:hypothetical protein HNP38_002518 [Chryseobacterium defluvii]|uniref:DoxX-like protein n=1 Tax=Chryseobacterium defluvii TaxID=160396 RepID=A0A840KHR4_9FLAO|nr:hypothetical protein [Chryseobacterium defluvii]MBB4807214.1 hypothetical protein [Chryseobacterium defluvii]
MKQRIFNILLPVVELAMVLVVSTAMLMYGVGKIIQFDHFSHVAKPVSELSGMELMWTFYAHSKPFAVIIGLLQISGAILLFFKRTRLIGGMLLSTVLINIILQDIFYDVNRGALWAAIIYQLMILAIFYIHRKPVLETFKGLLLPYTVKIDKRMVFIIAGGIVFAVVFKFLERLITH